MTGDLVPTGNNMFFQVTILVSGPQDMDMTLGLSKIEMRYPIPNKPVDATPFILAAGVPFVNYNTV